MSDEVRDMEVKSIGAFEIKDADRGEVTAVVATLGVVDKDGDVILPGAIPPHSKVKLSGYAHDTVLAGAPPVGIGTISEEGDKAVFRGRFFLSTERGREAFNTVKELGADGEWSFGFPRQVRVAELTDEWRGKGARRLIAGMRPIEASPVFIGAGVGTHTVVAKCADCAAKQTSCGCNAHASPAEPVDQPAPPPTEQKAEAADPPADESPVPDAEAEAEVAAKAAALAEFKLRAQEAVEDFHRIQRSLKRLKVV